MMRRLKDERGAAAVEFGIILSLGLLPLVLGTLEIGKALSTYVIVTSAAREGARSMVITNNASTAGSAAVSAAVGLNPPLKPGSSDATNGVFFPSIATCTGHAGQMMQVQ